MANKGCTAAASAPKRKLALDLFMPTNRVGDYTRKVRELQQSLPEAIDARLKQKRAVWAAAATAKGTRPETEQVKR